MWREYLKYLPTPLPKPELIEPLHLLRRFEDARHTGELVVHGELAEFTSLYQEHTGERFTKIELTRLPKATTTLAVGQAVMIPFTGGIASTAALWQALKAGRDVWLFYLEGFSVNEELERLSIRETIVNAHDAHGCPLLVLVENRLECRLVTLPNVYKLDPSQLSPIHPLAMLALYAQVMNAARAKGCGTVLWSGFWEHRPMMQALAKYYARIQPHTAEFAHEDQSSALAALLQADEQSKLTEDGALTSGPTLGANLLHRCCSCQRSPAVVAASQASVPSPLGGQCGDCAQCKPWIELCIHNTSMPVHRQVSCFGTETAPKPKKPARKRKAKDPDAAPTTKRKRSAKAKATTE